MALTNIEVVRMRIGLARQENPFYDLISDEEIEYHLSLYNQNINRVTLRCAHIILLSLSLIPTREKNGDVEVWFDPSKYRDALQQIIADNGRTSDLEGIIPFLAGMNRSIMCESLNNPDIVKSPLIETHKPLVTSCEEEGCGCA